MYVLLLNNGFLLRDLGISVLKESFIVIKTTDLDQAFKCKSKSDFDRILRIVSYQAEYDPKVITCSQFINLSGRGDI